MSKLKAKYHVLMARWHHENALFLSRLLGDRRFKSRAWSRANEKTLKHLMKIQ